MLVDLCILAMAQSKVTEYTKEAVAHLHHYCDTNIDAQLRFNSINGIAHAHQCIIPIIITR